MIFPVASLIALLSSSLTLQPGDLILTGTPAGVALGLPGQPWLRTGDTVHIGITDLGELHDVLAGR